MASCPIGREIEGPPFVDAIKGHHHVMFQCLVSDFERSNTVSQPPIAFNKKYMLMYYHNTIIIQDRSRQQQPNFVQIFNQYLFLHLFNYSIHGFRYTPPSNNLSFYCNINYIILNLIFNIQWD